MKGCPFSYGVHTCSKRPHNDLLVYAEIEAPNSVGKVEAKREAPLIGKVTLQ